MSTAETAHCLIVTGMPAAGKSTVTRLIARHLHRSARLDGDVMNELIVSGHVWALGEPADEAARQVQLCNRNLCDLAGNFYDAGFTAVIDWVIPTRAQLDFFVHRLAPRPVLLIVLSPGSEVCRTRNASRRQQFDFEGYDGLDLQMRRELGDIGWWFDTSDLNPEQTANRIVAEAGQRAAIS